MLDIGWTELLVIAVILIVVVGPKDLPPMIRAFGKMTKRLRQTAGEFRAQFDEALREAELEDIKRSVDDVRSLNPANSIREALNPLRQMGQDIRSDLERSTRFEAKSDAEDEGVDHSILPELPFGLDEPPQELRPAAQPVPSTPAAATAQAPAAVDPAPVAAAAVTTPVVAATAPAPSTPAPVAAVPVKVAKASGGKSAAKTAAPAKSVAKTAKTSPAAAAAEAPKAKAVRAKSSAPKTVEPAPAADIKVKAAPKPRKMKSEDRA